ncbi:hypothetical protein RRG08_055044 [Elysia crispata]|uniref:Uncharacterized protein n=1 Tax=Elysia crispata TaxID=231223 RepID=A0AAE1AZE9_9GAST|nr:hypothetical protein RRG08_055044 [Elysia crispata]
MGVEELMSSPGSGLAAADSPVSYNNPAQTSSRSIEVGRDLYLLGWATDSMAKVQPIDRFVISVVCTATGESLGARVCASGIPAAFSHQPTRGTDLIPEIRDEGHRPVKAGSED